MRLRASPWLLAAVGAVGLHAAPIAATSFPLNVEFDDGIVGTFGNVEVTEQVGGDLLFQITLDTTELGAGADLHELYINLADTITGVSITSSDVVNTAYELEADPSVAGGAGSSFAYGVNFGDGAGASGNGVLQTASFLLAADSDLTVDDLLISSSTSDGIEVFLAAHVQGTDLETVGNSVPEPTTFLLGALALAVAALRRR